ncbi:MAG: hypothetical protein UR52_C0002G0073 [Candidatus Gottesmanbacteria bacterium GW2011_GWA1_34_13]|uniref:Uncharacterized protein n=1 Tax=Candidatus Gottesmanbacteria bacterium GW2011_GWA1_34_13 TaxID=1618434 RepID=A0A0G0D959_9BACT|nr:MAG: hypothetical protein UR52_C0002G0073 [Candidatus Gottesmanbacteria bacterium GW2011_GWA1_34_13]
MVDNNEQLHFSEQETLKERASNLSTRYIETLRRVVNSNAVHKDKNTGHYKLTPDGRENSHKTFDTFFELADGNHQLLRLALDGAYRAVLSEIQQGEDEKGLNEQGWTLLRTSQSIQGVNTWQEANELYAKVTGKTAKESAISASELYKKSKEIRAQLESKGIPVSEYLEKDEKIASEIFESETEKLDSETATLLGRAKESIKKVKNKLTGWLPKNQRNRQPQVVVQISASEKDAPHIFSRKMTRRQFLRFSGATIATSVLATVLKVGLDPEFQAGVSAASTRPEMPGNGENHEVSLSVLLEVYRKHFQKKGQLMPEKVWVRNEESYQGKKLTGTGVHLSILARYCYNSDKKSGEDFDAYYTRFVDSLHGLSDLAGLDFITLVTSLQISAENIGGFEKPKGAKESSDLDVKVSRVQETVITASRILGLEPRVLESIGPGGFVIQAEDKARKAGIKTPLDNALPEEGIRHYDLIRFREQTTIGMMDTEPSERSEAYRLFQNNPLVKVLDKEYPQITKIYRIANEKRDAVTRLREEMRKAGNNFIEKYVDRLKPFVNGDVKALNAIGISPIMDLWQLQNYTDVWYKVSEIPNNPEFAYQRTVEYMKIEEEKDPKSFYKRFFSQQIRNPKFIKYLMHQATISNNQEESLLLLNIQDNVARYEQSAKELRIAYLNVLQAEGSFEYDSRFQQMTSVLVTKRLSEIAGDFNPNERNNLGWHIYKTCAIREIAPIPFLVNDDFYARDITIDPPYAQNEVVKSLNTFIDMLKRAKILEVDPDDDISTTYHIFEKMFWRDGGAWPNVPKEEWERILDHFNSKIVNRLFYDFAGLIHNEQIMPQLNNLMINKKLISKPADKDPYNFFKQIVYLELNSWHMRRDIPKKDWDEVEEYFRANILPIAITRTEITPGIFKEKYNIGSADYPPIFRSQAVMFNFLIDKNPKVPSSTSSSDILSYY